MKRLLIPSLIVTLAVLTLGCNSQSQNETKFSSISSQYNIVIEISKTPSAQNNQLCGGYRSITEKDLNDASLKNDVKICMEKIMNQFKTTPDYSKWDSSRPVRVTKIEMQVVAGINYRFNIEIELDKNIHQMTGVVWKKLDQSFELTQLSDTLKESN